MEIYGLERRVLMELRVMASGDSEMNHLSIQSPLHQTL